MDEPVLKADLKDNGGLVIFNSFEEIEAWVNQELEWWAWVNQIPGDFWNVIQTALNQIRGQARSAIQKQTDAGTAVNRIQQLITEHYITRPLPFPKTARRKHLEKIRVIHPQAAAFLANAWYGNTTDSAKNLGAAYAALFDLGFGKQGETAKTFKEAWDATLHEQTAGHIKYIAACEDRISKANELIGQLVATKTQQESEFKAKIDGVEQRIKLLEALFREKIALEAPVTYWEKERERCSTKSRWWTAGFVGAVIIGTLIMIYHRELLPYALPKPEEGEYWLTRYLPLLLVAFPIVWGWRLIARMMLSNVHLAADAAHRKVLTESYLALRKEGGAISDEDRHMLLTNLFRPVSAGVVKDDAAPPHWLELLVSRIQK